MGCVILFTHCPYNYFDRKYEILVPIEIHVQEWKAKIEFYLDIHTFGLDTFVEQSSFSTHVYHILMPIIAKIPVLPAINCHVLTETNRGYLIFSVKNRFLFHRINTKSCIFTSGKPRLKILLLVFMSEIKINLTPEKIQIFCFFHA